MTDLRILAVDDEKLMLDALTDSIRSAAPEAELFAFSRSSDAWACAQEHDIDVAFLDIRMRGMDGLELGRRLMERFPDLNLIFCTSFEEYVDEAFRKIRCNGYITKPVSADQIADELAHLRTPLKTAAQSRIVFRCLGRFEVFLDGKPLVFENAKTKELLAYLVHGCGGICGNQEIISQLWEDDYRHDSYFKKLRKDLVETLEANGCGNILYRQRGGIGINVKHVYCDFYKWREENPGKKPDEYMTQYIWANLPDYEW